MRVLNPRLDLDRFFATLAGARQRVLLVDYDGTLAPFHAKTECTAPYPRVVSLLNDIARTGSRIVVVSGRALAALHAPLERVASAEVWGAHGWQRRKADGTPVDYEPCAAARRRLATAEVRVRKLEADGARVERKQAALAVHWRGLDGRSIKSIGGRLRRSWRDAQKHGLQVLEFDGGIELRARARNKGHAVRKVLSECASGAVCAYLGDDRTDEDAFGAIRRRGLSVLVRPSLRPTRADLWLEPPRELVEFLDRWRSCTSGTP